MSDVDVKLTTDIGLTVRRLFGLGKDLNMANMEALARVGLLYATWIKQNIVARGVPAGKPFAPNAPSTINRKGSSKPLIDNADMKNSVRHQMDGKTVFIGLLRTTPHPAYTGGVANLGEIHEYGTRNGHIPARPFIEPVASSRSYQNRAISFYKTQVRAALARKGWRV